MLNGCLRFLMLKLLDLLSPSVLQEISHNTFDMFTFILQSFQEFFFLLNWCGLADFFHVFFILVFLIFFFFYCLIIFYDKKGFFSCKHILKLRAQLLHKLFIEVVNIHQISLSLFPRFRLFASWRCLSHSCTHACIKSRTQSSATAFETRADKALISWATPFLEI